MYFIWSSSYKSYCEGITNKCNVIHMYELIKRCYSFICINFSRSSSLRSWRHCLRFLHRIFCRKWGRWRWVHKRMWSMIFCCHFLHHSYELSWWYPAFIFPDNHRTSELLFQVLQGFNGIANSWLLKETKKLLCLSSIKVFIRHSMWKCISRRMWINRRHRK